MKIKPPTGSSNQEMFQFCQDVQKVLAGNIILGIATDSNGTPDFQTNSSTLGSHTLKNDPSKAWHINTDGNSSVAIPSGTGYDVATGSGILSIIAEDDGLGAIYFCFGGNVAKLGGAASYISGAPGTGQVGVVYNGGTNKYQIQNNVGATRNIHISLIKVRTNT